MDQPSFLNHMQVQGAPAHNLASSDVLQAPPYRPSNQLTYPSSTPSPSLRRYTAGLRSHHHLSQYPYSKPLRCTNTDYNSNDFTYIPGYKKWAPTDGISADITSIKPMTSPDSEWKPKSTSTSPLTYSEFLVQLLDYFHTSSDSSFHPSTSFKNAKLGPESGNCPLLTAQPPVASQIPKDQEEYTYLRSSPQFLQPSVPSYTEDEKMATQGYEAEIASLKASLREIEATREAQRARHAEFQIIPEAEKQMAEDVSPQFKAAWEARTQARIKILCAPNRVGNALCSW